MFRLANNTDLTVSLFNFSMPGFISFILYDLPLWLIGE